MNVSDAQIFIFGIFISLIVLGAFFSSIGFRIFFLAYLSKEQEENKLSEKVRSLDSSKGKKRGLS